MLVTMVMLHVSVTMAMVQVSEGVSSEDVWGGE